MDLFFKINMFITSFLPLWFSIVFINTWSIVEYAICNWLKDINWKNNLLYIAQARILELAVLIFAIILPIVSMICISQFLKNKFEGHNKQKATIKSAKKANKLTSEFLLAYILPMIAFDFSAPRDLVLFTIYFLVLATLCISNDNIYTNIFLEFKKYKLYECDIERLVIGTNQTYCNTLVISRTDVTEPTNYNMEVYDFENYIYINLKE